MATAQKVDYRVVSPSEWDRMPDPHIKPPSPWIPVLDALQTGQIVQIGYTDRKDKISKRISLARQALKRGFRTEVRYTETHLAIRKIPFETPQAQAQEEPESSEVSPIEPSPVIRRRGRGRKTLSREQQEQVTLE